MSKTCAAEDCDNLVHGERAHWPSTKFCQPRCRTRTNARIMRRRRGMKVVPQRARKW